MAAKEKAKKKLSGRWNLYEKKGDKIERKNKSCPKCGAGTFMARHSSRWTCGQCHMTEFISKKE